MLTQPSSLTDLRASFVLESISPGTGMEASFRVVLPENLVECFDKL